MQRHKERAVQTEPLEIARKFTTQDQEIQIYLEDPHLQARVDFLNELMSEKNKRIAAKILGKHQIVTSLTNSC